MGGEGHMLDMIHRLRQGREASRLNRERRNQQLKKMQMGNSLSMPDTTPEEMEYIIKETKIKKEKDAHYFTWGTLIIFGITVALFFILWKLFIQ